MIPAGGYQWHYLDGVSDDNNSAIVVIALFGNPFSPGYARARRRGPASPLAYCSMHVALYSRHASRWALAESTVSDVDRNEASASIGSSTMCWDGDRLVVDLDERSTPFGRPIAGRVVLRPEAHTALSLDIDDGGLHRWWPVAPLARIEVELSRPGVRFSGHGYHDANAGAVPLESTFESWSWSRARTERGAILSYDTICSSGIARSHAFKVSNRAELEQLESKAPASLPRTKWGLTRRTRSDSASAQPRIVRSLEDGPFYARALIESRIDGRPVMAMHETLAAHRLRRSWVHFLSAFRMSNPSKPGASG